MNLKLGLCTVISMVFLVACSDQAYDKNEVIATLKGVDIKVSDILTQYPVEEKYIEIFLKEEIVIHEAKKMGIKVSRQKLEELKQTLYPSGESTQIEDFHREQAAVLGITEEEYYEMWSSTYLERNEYIQEYIRANFDEPSSDKDVAAWGKEIENHINNLFASYKDNKDLIINWTSLHAYSSLTELKGNAKNIIYQREVDRAIDVLGSGTRK